MCVRFLGVGIDPRVPLKLEAKRTLKTLSFGWPKTLGSGWSILPAYCGCWEPAKMSEVYVSLLIYERSCILLNPIRETGT